MSLLAEEIVEEWLNRQGYFTIRGVKLGVHEIDLLAVRPAADGLERRHVEVQVSFRPVSYITKVPKEVQKRTGQASGSAKRRPEAQLRKSVAEWVEKKYGLAVKQKLMQRLCSGEWTRELVVNAVKHDEEVLEIQRQGVTVHRLAHIVREMTHGSGLVEGAISGDIFDLMGVLKGDA